MMSYHRSFMGYESYEFIDFIAPRPYNNINFYLIVRVISYLFISIRFQKYKSYLRSCFLVASGTRTQYIILKNAMRDLPTHVLFTAHCEQENIIFFMR